MKPPSSTEITIIGVIFLLFGISWIGFAATLPVPPAGSCLSGPVFVSNLPQCGPTPLAGAFYVLGVIAIVIGMVLLFIRFIRLPQNIPKILKEGFLTD